MCGICGAIWTDPSKAISAETLDRMTDILTHRGPDDRGVYRQNQVALGHRRLSILDLSSLGHQPMPNEDESVWIVFNGEIYNFEPLRQELLKQGHRFHGKSDTEVLIHLYEEYGLDMLARLNGMFAFAIWDSKRNRIFLARDRIGKKPLFYRCEPRRLIFASELKSILENGDIPREVDPVALSEYLTYQYVPHPRTIYHGIAKLPPGHFAVWENDRLEVKRYWNIDFNEEDDSQLTFGEWSEQFRALVTDAVKIRLRSDVPLGAFLSGGIDSSITAGIMQQESSQQIRTFSIGFAQKEYDETAYAKQAAEQFGTKHQKFIVSPDIEDILPKLVWHYDEPFADSSAIPTWYLCQATRQEVTVALSGDGGDELFAGYDRYRAMQLADRVNGFPVWLRRLLAGPVRGLIPASTRQRSFLRRIKRFMEALAMEPMERYLQWIAIFNRQRSTDLYTSEFAETIRDANPLQFLLDGETRCINRDSLTRISLVDMQTYLPCDIMTKVDIASMAHSLECRAPLLDYRIAEWASKLPIRHKIQGSQGKMILRKTFENLLPNDIQTRPKMGFGVPIDHWFRGPLREMVHDLLLDSRALERGFFRKKTITKLLDNHFSNRFDHAYRIWALVVLELWFRRWMDS